MPDQQASGVQPRASSSGGRPRVAGLPAVPRCRAPRPAPVAWSSHRCRADPTVRRRRIRILPAAFAGSAAFAGCQGTASGLPLQVSAFGTPQTSVAYRTVNGGEWDAAYDIWFDSSADPAGQNNGAELMIWGNHRGAPQPAGQKIGTANGTRLQIWDCYGSGTQPNPVWSLR
ncbi:hypothetical protein [Kitasatospora herbaricolor]|uniref:GH12 family glycosyl hydrolase domain-containing protein n=1 Tax=Kitasatospora herbaricolor TaxID=68217 RepID=UPI0036DAA720